MVIALTPDETFEFVCEEDRKKSDEEKTFVPTVWTLRYLSSIEFQNLKDMIVRTDRRTNDEKMMLGSYERAVLRTGLGGWTNFLDKNGHPVEFGAQKTLNILGKNRPTIDDALLDRIPPRTRQELANAITRQEVTEVSEEERKN